MPVVGALDSRVGPAKRVEISGKRVVVKAAPGTRIDGAQAVMTKTSTTANMAAVHADMRSIFSGFPPLAPLAWLWRRIKNAFGDG